MTMQKPRPLSSISRINELVMRRVNAARAGSDDGVALMSAILFMVLLSGMSLVLLGVILGQINPSYAAQKGTKTVNAAQAGLQAGLGVVRSATTGPDSTGTSYGSTNLLPCSFSGNVDGTTNTVSYSVTLQYFTVDPTGKSTTWLDANDLTCSLGTAMKDSTGAAVTPLYAVITSKGSGTGQSGSSSSDGSRSVAAIYKFRVSNVNIPGGRIYDGSKQYCLQATYSLFTFIGLTNATIQWVPVSQCTAANNSSQLWVYDVDYEIKLASSTATGQTPVCITGPVTASGSNTTGSQWARLEKCQSDSSRWNQLWSWQGSASWSGQQNPISNGNSGYCIGSPTGVSTGAYLWVNNGCNGSFAPEPAVGAGAASYNTHQMVNYKEFGRCADVTNQNISTTFQIVYPCKQDPTGTGNNLLWNHKWYYTEPDSYTTPSSTNTSRVNQIYVKYNETTKYCLATPVSPGSSAFPTFTTACNTSDIKQQWTRYYDTGDYSTSYTFVDGYGRCLTADSSQKYGDWSEMTVATCNGSEAQKWNAPATYNNSTFGSYREVAGG